MGVIIPEERWRLSVYLPLSLRQIPLRNAARRPRALLLTPRHLLMRARTIVRKAGYVPDSVRWNTTCSA